MSTNTPTDPAVNPNKALWEKGDFTRIAESMRRSGEALVATLEITPGLDVLDLGCGDGTTALTLAPSWAAGRSPPGTRAPKVSAWPTSGSRRAMRRT
jgi:hypothetical protein